MSDREIAVAGVSLLVVLAAVSCSVGLVVGVSTVAAAADFSVEEADLEDETIAEGERAAVTAVVENAGNETGTFTAELRTDSGGVVDTTDVEVEAGETATVEFSEPFDEAGTYELSVNGESAGTLTVTEPASAEFSVTDVTLSDDEIEVGDSVDVTADIENTGDADGTYTADLVVDDELRDTTRVDVAAGDTETVTFAPSFETAGDYTVSVGDGSTQELEVNSEPADVSITDASLSETDIDPGDAVTVTATAVNDGGSSGEVTADLRVDGATRGSETRTLDPDAEATIEFTPTFEESGTYDISVSDVAAGTLNVSEPAAFEVSDARLEDDTLLAGDIAVVSAEVTNVGDTEGTFTAEAGATGQDGTSVRIDSRSVTLAGGDSETIELRGPVEQAGEYDVSVEGTAAGTLTVDAPADPTVTDATLEETAVVEGDRVTVTATVENTGDREGSLSVVVAADGTTEVTGEVTVPARERRTEEFTYTAAEPGEYDVAVNDVDAGTLTVSEPAAAEFSVRDVTLSDAEIEVGDSVDVTADIENTGDADGTYPVDLIVNDEVRDTTRVDVAAGDTETVTFRRSFETAGDYAVGVGDAPTQELEVNPEPADISITGASLSETDIDPGDAVTVTATAVNDGGSSGEVTAELRVDGVTRDSESRTLDPGSEATIEFTPTFDGSGTYEVSVNDVTAGTLDVAEPAAFEVSDAELEDDTILAGGDAVVSAEVTNVGDTEGTYRFEARATGDGTTETLDTDSVTLEGGESETIELRGSVDRAGEYEVQVDRETAGTLTVDSPAELTVTDASLEEDVVSVSDEVAVTVAVENTGDREGSLSVAVEADGDERAATEVTLGPGESTEEELTYTATASGGYEIKANDEDAGTLTVIEPATFRTTNADVEPTTVLEGESADVTATVVNVGSESGVHTATLRVDGETVESEDRVIGPGDSETISFSPTFETAIEVDIAVNGESAGTLSVLEPADVSVRETELSPETITTGESATVTVELANDGDVEGEFTTRLRNGNETLDTVTRTVGPDGNEAVRFERTFQSPGEYELEVNDESVGTLAVLEPADVSLGESSLASESVERNESIELTVELRNDGEATGAQNIDITLGDGTEIQRTPSVPDGGTTVTVTHAYTATGTYTVAVDGATVGTVNVVEPREDARSGDAGGGGSSESTDPSGSSGGSGSSGTGGSSGATGGSGGAPTTDPEPTVARSVSKEAVAVDVSGADGERFEAAVELAGPSTSEPAVSMSSFAVDPAGERDAFEATVGRPTAEPDGTDPVPHGVALGYVSLNSTLDESETSGVTLQFSVDETSIPAGLGPEDVTVMRYADDGWTTANVTLERAADGQTATLPRASPVAVVALEPGSVEVVETVGPADRVRPGYETRLRVTVENTGDRRANRTLTVAMDGEPVAEREVTLGPGQNETVPIAFEPPEEGTVSFEGDEVGEITFLREANGSESATGDTTEEETPGFGVVAAVLALVAAAGFGARRRRW